MAFLLWIGSCRAAAWSFVGGLAHVFLLLSHIEVHYYYTIQTVTMKHTSIPPVTKILSFFFPIRYEIAVLSCLFVHSISHVTIVSSDSCGPCSALLRRRHFRVFTRSKKLVDMSFY